jgi:predicted GIY-YIG superfamily endonuclease
MPRKDINYSNTIIYQITCKNKNVSDMYISYTTNLTQRKYKHKRESLDLSVKSRLYDSIRKNGGWENWNCVILEECVCKNEYLAKERMNFYILKNKPKLNDENLDDLLFQYEALNSSIYENIENDESIENVENTIDADDKEDGKYVCQCKKTYTHRSSYYKHTTTCLQFQHRHKNDISMNTLTMSFTTTTTVSATIAQQQPRGDVITSTIINAPAPESDDNDTIVVRHRFKPRKIASNVVENEVFHYSDEPEPEPESDPVYSMNCDNRRDDRSDDSRDENSISSRSSSSSSSSSSISSSSIDDSVSDIDDGVSQSDGASEMTNVSDIITAQNDKLRNYIRKMISALSGANGKKRNKKSILDSLVYELLDQNKTLQKQLVELSKERNVIVNNTNNNQFNLNFFLNEQCKNAVNFTDFINSLEITMDDLAYTRNQGLVEGISKVMIDGLKQMDLYKRPIHCTDHKRDIIYLHDEKQWARDEGNTRMRQAFIDIANKEYFAIKKWMDLHPGWETNQRLQEFHHKMLGNVLHEIKDDPIGERKIMKSVAREVLIER